MIMKNTGWNVIFPSWPLNSTSGIRFTSSTLSPQVTGTIKLGGVLKQTPRWVTGGCQRGRGWQAAVTVVLLPHKLLQLVKLQASPGRSLLPAPYSPPSVHWSLSSPPLPPSSAFLVGRCFISHRLSMMLFRLSPLIYSHSPASSHLSNSSFMKWLEREAVDIRRIWLSYTCLTSFTGRSHQRCWLFVRKLLVLSVQFKREKSELLSHSVFPLCCQAEKDFIV